MPGWSWSILGVAVVLGTWAAWFWSPLRHLRRLMGLSSTERLPEHAVDLLAKERPRDVLKLAQYSQSSVRDVFYDGLRDVKGLIARFGITPFVEVARISGPKTGRVFRYGFPLVQDQIHNTELMLITARTWAWDRTSSENGPILTLIDVRRSCRRFRILSMIFPGCGIS